MGKLERKLSSSQMIILGFAAVILLGALLLMLPVSSKSGEITPFLDCLLTSTSAVCVTGLVVYDTAAHWTVFGQAIIIVLIQIGGHGRYHSSCCDYNGSRKENLLDAKKHNAGCNFRTAGWRHCPIHWFHLERHRNY